MSRAIVSIGSMGIKCSWKSDSDWEVPAKRKMIENTLACVFESKKSMFCKISGMAPLRSTEAGASGTTFSKARMQLRVRS